MRSASRRGLAALAALAALLSLGLEAHAVVGRPLTPVSYAGVARRTTRRTVYAGAAVAGAATAGAAYAGAAAVSTLPAGCAPGVACGGTVYQPVYQGSNLTYVPQ
jgi:hypothetical protein